MKFSFRTAISITKNVTGLWDVIIQVSNNDYPNKKKKN